jgi:hypothetical protein
LDWNYGQQVVYLGPLHLKRGSRSSPRTSVRESGANSSSGTHYRSAISGRYIGPAAAARHPNTSLSEQG